MPKEVDAAVRRITELTEQASVIEAEIKRQREIIVRALGLGRHFICGMNVSISRQRRFNATKAWNVLPEEWRDKVTKPIVDRVLAMQKLPPELYLACQTESDDYTVRIS